MSLRGESNCVSRRELDRIVSALLAATFVLACGPSEKAEVTGYVRDGRTGLALARAVLRGEDGARATADDRGRFAIRLPIGTDRALAAIADGRCEREVEVDVTKGRTPEVTINLFPRVEVEEEHPQVGFGREVTLRVQTRCDDVPVRWRQTSGPALGRDRMRSHDDGRRLVVRTHRLEELITLDDRVGVVPISRRERGDYRFEASIELGNGRRETRAVRVTASAPSAGVFQVPTGHDTYLNGGASETHQWVLADKPPQSRAELVDPTSRTPHFRPDRFGQYLIRHQPSGVELNIQAGAYESVPRDCGRDGCHRPEDRGWETTKHARTFRRGIEGELGEAFGPRCWSCHATGVDPGVDNGGLHLTARRVGYEQGEPHAGAWDELPRRFRRHASVWCSACHGPGRILPPQFKWEYGAKFQSGVCAQCHDVVDDPDANHTSPEVAEWRLAKMSRFARNLEPSDPALRAGCASCHSAQGFVEWMRHDTRSAPDRITVTSIACTTCHDPHSGENPSALRVLDVVAGGVGGADATGLGKGAVCASCHRSGQVPGDTRGAAPHSPQADVLLGRGARLVRAFAGSPGPHARLAESCVECHMARPPEGDALFMRAGGHTFAIRDATTPQGTPYSAAACARCHEGAVPASLGAGRDLDGDGQPGELAAEVGRAIAAARTSLRARIAAAGTRDGCTPARVAADFVDHDARLVLVDAQGAFLGDCDSDRAPGESETWRTTADLPGPLGELAYDVAFVERDGSYGHHNPPFVADVLRVVRQRLR